MIQTAFDTTAVSHPTFEQEVGGTVGELASNLNTQFNYLSDALTTDYNTIVYDWGRLSEVGPKTLQSGYWGFFWPERSDRYHRAYMVNGYQITVMRALLPLVYNLHPIVGQTSASANPYGAEQSAELCAVCVGLRQRSDYSRAYLLSNKLAQLLQSGVLGDGSRDS